MQFNLRREKMKTIIFAVALFFVSFAQAASVTVDDPTCGAYGQSTVNGNLFITCVLATTPNAPGTPFCSIMPTATSITAGQSVSLNISCSPSPTSYAWSGPGITAPTVASQIVTPTVTSTYTLTGSNQYGQGNTATVTITVNQPAPPPPPADACISQSLTNTTIALDWGGGVVRNFSMNANQSISFGLQIPPEGAGGQISTVYGNSEKEMSISKTKCDFTPALAASHCLSAGSDPALYYSTGPSFYACRLEAGTTYYVNTRNAVLSNGVPVVPTQDSCTSGACQFSIQY